MKRLGMQIALCVFLPAVMLSAGGKKEAAVPDDSKPVVIKLGSVANEGNIQYEAARRFAEAASKRSGGNTAVQLFFGAQLGNEADMIDMLQVGGIQMMQSFPSNWSSFVPEIGVLDLPFQFTGFDHVRRVTDGEVGKKLDELIRKKTGITVLRWWPHGFRHLYTKKPIRKASDMAGLQIRVPGTEVFKRIFELLGASPVSVPWPELYTALQTNLVKAADADLSGALASGFAEVTRYVIKTGHMYTASFLVIKESFFAALSKKQQQALAEAADEAESWLHKTVNELAKRDEQKAKDAGMEIIEPDLESFRSKLRPIVEDFRKKADVNALLETINKLR